MEKREKKNTKRNEQIILFNLNVSILNYTQNDRMTKG